jgi:hypothetical protein
MLISIFPSRRLTAIERYGSMCIERGDPPRRDRGDDRLEVSQMLDPITLTAVAEDRMQAAREAARRGQLRRPRRTRRFATLLGRVRTRPPRDTRTDELIRAA